MVTVRGLLSLVTVHGLVQQGSSLCAAGAPTVLLKVSHMYHYYRNIADHILIKQCSHLPFPATLILSSGVIHCKQWDQGR